MSRKPIWGIVLLVVMVSGWWLQQGPHSLANASFTVATGCDRFLPNGKAPHFDKASYSQDVQSLCFDEYRTLYSGKTRTALWSAELLTPAQIAATQGLKRVNAFHAEPQLPEEWQAKNSDYVRSGYDKGHLAPSGDMSTPEAQHQSFSLANMAPQWPTLNRSPWAHLEEAIRARASNGPLYVLTGVLFEGNQIGFLKGRVAVPSVFYKVVFDPIHREASVYWAPNEAQSEVQQMSVSEFEQSKGIQFGLGEVSPLSLHFSNQARH